MAAAIGARSDYTSSGLRGFARRSSDADQVRRLLAVALILDGGSRSEAAKIAAVTLQIVRDCVLRFNQKGPDGLATRKLRSELRSAARAAGRNRRGWADSCSAWRSALAAVRFGAVDLGRVRAVGHPPHSWARASHDELPQAHGPATHRGQKRDYIADFKKVCHPSGASQAAPPPEIRQ